MDGKSVTLMIRHRMDDGTWKRSLAARAGNGRIRSGYALIDGNSVRSDQFYYEIRFWSDGSTKYENVGKNPYDAEIKRQLKERQLVIKSAAPNANLLVVEGPERNTLAATAAAYIQNKEDNQFSEAAMQARLVTREFIETCRKRFIDEISEQDITGFHKALRKRGCEPRTVANKHRRLTSWLRFAGIDKSVLPPCPKYEQQLPTIFNRDEISTLMANASPYLHMMIQLGLKAGLRDQELMHVEFSDIDRHEKTLRVRGKPRWGFTIKDYEQRDIPLPDDVLQELTDWKRKNKTHSLILPTRNGNPNGHLLYNLKGLVRRSKLNCGRCDACKSKRKQCEEFTLHKFRRTCLTRWLQSGIDLRTVQAWAGHADLTSTMRYLRPASGDEVRDKVNSVRW